MNKEKRIIALIDQIMPKSKAQLNRLHESDTEIVKFGQKDLLVTMDEFSQEDMLREHDPYNLGWNLAVGAISDILASGGRPLYYAHSMTINNNWTEEYVKDFSRGVAAVLKKADTSFIGGDFGQSEIWRYTAMCLGEPIHKPVLRSQAQEGDLLYLTGEVGAGNLEAVLKLYTNKQVLGAIIKKVKNCFQLRIAESILVSKYATSCIDTSDGCFNALNTLAELSHKGYEVARLPYLKYGLMASELMGLPKTMLFLGECGEYELLCTIRSRDEEKFLAEARQQKLKFHKIGQITSPGKKILQEDGREMDLTQINLSGRDFSDVKEYISELIKLSD
jgi:thiamine-monophosphate kinase